MSINLNVNANTAPFEAQVQAAVNRIRSRPIKITVDDKGATQPLGNMRRSADEFSKSMEAANARILAFGASMAVINGVGNAFKAMVQDMVEVEKKLADINVVMDLSAQNLERFGNGLFNVAKEAGAAFNVAADAATEYARQGLGVEESLKRTRDALILTRLTGMDSANAVKSLTAAMNTYGSQIKDTTQLVSKFAAVDVKFAVSAEDFADAIARTGATARDAGVHIDELIGFVTAAQQQTARGGKVIGNSFKTIFTRIQRTDTLDQLEGLGIAVRDVEGKTLSATRILKDLANTFDTLNDSQRSQVAQTVGGVFQMNILKAVLGDAAKQNSILADATQISAGATDEAIAKNEQLRQTMGALATETGLALKQVSAQVGEIMLAPGIEKILNTVKSMSEGLTGLLGEGEKEGSSFAKGLLTGIGNVLSGPGLVVFTVVFGKLFFKAMVYAKDSLRSLIGITSQAQKQKAIQSSLVGFIGQNATLSKEILRTDISRTQKEQTILALLKAQVREAALLSSVAKSSSTMLYRQGYGANLQPRRGRAEGYIPNFAHPERQQAAKSGYAAGNIRSMNMPGEGSVIYNSAEKVKNFAGFKQPAIMPPQSSRAGQNYQQAFGSVHGFDPYASGGYIPNFNKSPAAAKKPLKGQAIINRILADGQIDLNNGEVAGNLAQGLGILLGTGPEGFASKKYTQSYSSLSKSKALMPGTPQFKIVSKIAAKAGMSAQRNKVHQDILAKNPSVTATLKTGAVLPVSEKDIKELGEEAGGMKVIKGMINGPLNQAVKKISQRISKPFQPKGKSIIMPGDIWSKNSAGTKANDVIGTIGEMAIRGGLNAIIPQVGKKLEGADAGGAAGAAFDFTGGHAGAINEFFGGAGLSAYEMKLRASTATGKSGGIPKKVINYKLLGDGYIPNFADPLSNAIGREKGAGVPVSQIRVNSHPALMGQSNPLGLGITNTYDEPNGLRDVFGANGFVPNYSLNPLPKVAALASKVQNSRFMKEMEKGADAIKDYKENLKKSEKEIEKYTKTQVQHRKAVDKYTKDSRKAAAGTKEETNAKRKLTQAKIHEASASRKLTAATTRQAALGKTGAGVGGFGGRMMGRMSKLGSGNAGMMMMMGAPMAAGMMQQGDVAELGHGYKGGDLSYQSGGALTGAATGAMMAMMLAPLTGPFAPLTIAIGALGGAIYGGLKATEENTKAVMENARQQGAARAKSTTSVMMKALGGADVKTLTKYSKRLTDLMSNINQERLKPKDTLAQIDVIKEILKDPNIDKDKKFEINKEEAKAWGLGSQTTATINDVLGATVSLKTTLEAAEESVRGLKGQRDRGGSFDTKDQAALAKAMEFEKEVRQSVNESLRKLDASLQIAAQAEGENAKGLIKKLRIARAAEEIQMRINKDMSLMRMESEKALSAYSWVAEFGIQGNEIVKTQIDFMKAMDEASENLKLSEFKIKGDSVITAMKEVNVLDKSSKQALIDFISKKENGQLVNMREVTGISGDQLRGIDSKSRISQNQHGVDEADFAGVLAELDFDQVIEVFKKIGHEKGQEKFKELAEKLVNLQKKELGVAKQLNAEKLVTLETNNEIDAHVARRIEKEKLLTKEISTQNSFLAHQSRQLELNTKISELRFKDQNPFATKRQKLSYSLGEMRSKNAETQTLDEQQLARDMADKIVDIYKELGRKGSVPDSLIQARGIGSLNRVVKEDEALGALGKNTEIGVLEARVARKRKKIKDESVELKALVETKRANIMQSEWDSQKQMHDKGKSGTALLGSNIPRSLQYIPDEKVFNEIANDSKQLDALDLSKDEFLREAHKLVPSGAQQVKKMSSDDLEEIRQKSKDKVDALKKEREAIEEQDKQIKKLQELEKLGPDIIKRRREELRLEFKTRKKNIDLQKEAHTLEESNLLQNSPGGFSKGFRTARKDSIDRLDYFDEDLMENMTNNFRNGLVEGMQAAINKADDLESVMTNIATNFLSAIQQAYLGKAADIIVGAMPFSDGGEVRNYSRGGKVPAMVSNGEYVMSGSAVKKYGGGFMHGLNAGGKLPAFNSGGQMTLEKFFGSPIKTREKTLQEYFGSPIKQSGRGSSGGFSLDTKSGQSGRGSSGGFSLDTKSGSQGLSDFFGKEISQKPQMGPKGGFLSGLFEGFMSLLMAPFKALGSIFKFNSGGKIPHLSAGGDPGSALAANFGGGEGYATGRAYQSKAMSGFFYSGQAGNGGLDEDAQYTRGIIQERMRKEAEKKAKKKRLMNTLIGTALSIGLSYGVGKIMDPTGTGLAKGEIGDKVMTKRGLSPMGEKLGYGTHTPRGTRVSRGMDGSIYSQLPQRGMGRSYDGYASGGHISGKSGIDQIPAMLSEGEYVIRASSARQVGKPTLDMINAGKFNDGGSADKLAERMDSNSSGGNTNNISISVNVNKGKVSGETGDSKSNNPADVSSDKEKNTAMAQKIKSQVVNVIIEEQRPGGLLSD